MLKSRARERTNTHIGQRQAFAVPRRQWNKRDDGSSEMVVHIAHNASSSSHCVVVREAHKSFDNNMLHFVASKLLSAIVVVAVVVDVAV